MKNKTFTQCVLLCLAQTILISSAQAIKIVVPDQYKDQVEAIKEAEQVERQKELEADPEAVEALEDEAAVSAKESVDADAFLLQSVVEATDAAASFEDSLAADQGIISGQVVNQETGEPVDGVAILLEGTAISTLTDSDGRYSIGPAPAGEYTLSFIKGGYIEANVTEYTVAGGEVSVFPFALPPRPLEMSDEVYELQDFTVTAEEAANLMVALLDLRQTSIASLDVLGSEDFSRFGASDAADALKSVTGVSISGGKFAVVRGLDDRFSTTSLNGIVIPSPDPDRLAVPLDIFPAGLLESVTTQKSYTADQPGESSGGAINLITKSFPDEFKAKISTGVSYNENATGEEDFLLAESENFQASPFRFAPRRKKPGLNSSYSGEIGNSFDWRGFEIGFVGGFSYSEDYKYSEVKRNRYEANGSDANLVSSAVQELGEYEEQLSALIGASIRFSEQTSLRYNFLFAEKEEAVGSFSTIETDAGADNLRFETNASTVEREYFNHQIVLDHSFERLFNFENVNVTLSGAYSENTQDEPDTRVSDRLQEGTNPGEFDSADLANPQRFERFLEQEDLILKLDVEVPLGLDFLHESVLEFGFSDEDSERVASQREFVGVDIDDSTLGEIGGSNPDTIIDLGFGDPIVIPGEPQFVDIPDVTVFRTGVAESVRKVRSVYLQSRIKPVENLELSFGVRLEDTFIQASSIEPGFITRFEFTPFIRETAIDELSVLPAFTSTYEIAEDFQVRVGFSETVAKPSFRELNPNPTFNPSEGDAEIGNSSVTFQNEEAFNNNDTDVTVLPEEFSGLELVGVVNGDVRFEWFPSDSELVAMSFFYKQVDGPIERIEALTGDGESFTFFNNDNKADVFGIEFEARSELGSLVDWLEGFYVGGNFTYIDAEVDRSSLELLRLPEEASESRPLFNQPENIINAFVGFRSDELGLDVTLSGNQVGEQLYAISSSGDIFIEPHLTLNLVINWQVTDNISLKFSAKNLLDPVKERSLDAFSNVVDTDGISDDGGIADSGSDLSIRDSFRSGRSYGVSASYTF